MGILAEYCPDLCLRGFDNFVSGLRKESECLPKEVIVGHVYNFLKKGQKHYWLLGEIPMRETKGNGFLSKTLASVKILELTHFVIGGEVWTKGKYEVIEVYELNEDKVHFDGVEKIG